MSCCIGWLFDVSIDHDQAVIWIKTADKKILKLRDLYHPAFYILPLSESDGLYLFQILSRQLDIVNSKIRDYSSALNSGLSNVSNRSETATSGIKKYTSNGKIIED
jgi:hypothetical protein